MRDDNQTIFCSPYAFLSICTVINFYKKWGYEIVKVETKYSWFNIKHITVPVKKNSYYTLWWFTEVPLRSHDNVFQSVILPIR